MRTGAFTLEPAILPAGSPARQCRTLSLDPSAACPLGLGLEQQPPGWGQARVRARPLCSLKELKSRMRAWFAELGTGWMHLGGPLPNPRRGLPTPREGPGVSTPVSTSALPPGRGHGLEPCLAGKL